MGLKTSLLCSMLAVYMLLYPYNPSCNASVTQAYNSTSTAPLVIDALLSRCTVDMMLSPFTTGPLFWLMPLTLMMISLIHGYKWFTREWDDDWTTPDRDITRSEPWTEEEPETRNDS